MIKLPEPATVTVLQGISYYTEAQLKQAVRDAYEDAANLCKSEALSFSWTEDQSSMAAHLHDGIRALIKGIDA